MEIGCYFSELSLPFSQKVTGIYYMKGKTAGCEKKEFHG